MINTLKIPSTPTFRLSRLLGISAALLLTSATASFAALSAADRLIDVQLQSKHGAATTLTVKTTAIPPQFIADAAIDAINALAPESKVLPSAVVTASLARVPQFAGDISKAALAKVYLGAVPFKSLNTVAKQNAQASAIVSAAFAKGLAVYKPGKLPNGNTYIGAGDKSNIAAEITFQNIGALGANPASLVIGTDAKTPSPVQVVVIAAVKAAIKIKGVAVNPNAKVNVTTNPIDLEHNAVSGTVAGAIFKAAGTDNASIKDSLVGNDAVVKAILKAAAKTAPTHALEIAQAAGYAFATTYRQTHNTATPEVTLAQFITDNTADIVLAIKSGLSAANVKKFDADSKVKGQNFGQTLTKLVQAGITKAYATSGSLGGSGRGGVTFANGSATPVTPVN